jgi:hypothetical protein
MARKFFTDVDLQTNAIRNGVVDPQTTPPSSPVAGQIYFDTDDLIIYVYNGTVWTAMGATYTGGAGLTLSGTDFSVNVDSTTIEINADTLRIAATAAGNGLTGGGGSALAVNTGSGLEISSDAVRIAASAAGAGLIGGAGSALAVGAGTGITVNADDVAVDTSVIATKAYVDAIAQGLDAKNSVRVATTATGTLATAYENGDTVDGVTLATNDRILIKNQSAPAENGIYTVNASGAPTRAVDMDAWTEVPNAYVWVEEGTVNGDTGWVCTANTGGTINSTSMTWTLFASAGSFIAGAGLTKTGNAIDIIATDTSLTVNADDVGVNVNSSGGLEISSGVRVKLDGATLSRSSSGLKVTDNTYQPLDATLTALAAYNTNGLLTQTAADTFTGRTLTGTSNRISVTNGNGVSGNPTVDIDSAYVGQATITTLGTITTGTWTGTTIALANGGTGSTTASGARTNLVAAGYYSSATHSSGSSITITQATHGLRASRGLVVQAQIDSTGAVIDADVSVASSGDVTVGFNGASQSANTIRVTIVG